MEINQIPVIDWELGLKLAGNQRDLAEDMLDILVSTLEDDIALINKLHTNQEYDQLLRHIHKLHGAVCYCGLPRLKPVLSKLESDLKKNIMISLPSFLHQLNTEVSLLLEHYPVKKTA